MGIEPIRKRLETDEQIFHQLLKLHGVPKVFLRNSIPAAEASNYVDDYELTPEYGYELEVSGPDRVRITESPWTVKDDNGVTSNSLLPAAVVVGMIKQIAQVLHL